MLHKAEELGTYKLRSSDGELGKIEDLYFDDRFWTVRYLVVDSGGWLVQRRVLVSPRAVVGVDRENKTIASELTKAQVEKSPLPDEHPPVSRQFEIAYNEYYDYSPYWVGPFARGTLTAPLPAEDAARLEERDSWDSHLYSAKDLSGFARYAVTATDGDVGHVADLIVSDEDWAIRYFVVDTRDWLPGKQVLVPPQWTKVDWEGATVSAELTRDTVKAAPKYDTHVPIDRQYEAELYRHYCRQSYWSDDSICYDPPAPKTPDQS
jgi:uncharacterized protein YrrD